MHHRSDPLVRNKATFMLGALSLGTLSLFAAGCGTQPSAELDTIDQRLETIERVLPGKTGDQLAALCLDYASICERSAGICLGVESSALVRRCDAITARCERNLDGYCGHTPQRRDARVETDSVVPQRDAGPARDSGPSIDARPSDDASLVVDARVPPPSCRALLSPGGGDVSTLFFVDMESDGASCSWAIDYAPQGPIPCRMGIRPLMFPPGVHWVTLYAEGPGGAVQCTSAPIDVRDLRP